MMGASVDFIVGLGIGLIVMGIVAMIATDHLIRHYSRKGWLWFPQQRDYRQACLASVAGYGNNPWMVYGAKCDSFREEICATAKLHGSTPWQCQGDGTVPERYRHLYPSEAT